MCASWPTIVETLHGVLTGVDRDGARSDITQERSGRNKTQCCRYTPDISTYLANITRQCTNKAVAPTAAAAATDTQTGMKTGVHTYRFAHEWGGSATAPDNS